MTSKYSHSGYPTARVDDTVSNTLDQSASNESIQSTGDDRDESPLQSDTTSSATHGETSEITASSNTTQPEKAAKNTRKSKRSSMYGVTSDPEKLISFLIHAT